MADRESDDAARACRVVRITIEGAQKLTPDLIRWTFPAEFATLDGMDARLHHDATDFGSVARWVYRRDPVLFTSELTALRATRWSDPLNLLSVVDDDGEVGAALQMPGQPLLVNGLPPTMAKAAAVEMVTAGRELSEVRGTASTATAFVTAWSELTGCHATETTSQTLYRLDELSAPDGVPGVARRAEAFDEELVVDWLDGFFVDAHQFTPDRGSRRGVLRNIIDNCGEIVLWSVDGAPVSMARVHAPAAGMCRIGPVYTPPDGRAHGFGAAVTAAAVGHAHRIGARDVVLFADVANPGANRIYRRLGFVPVADSLEFAFSG